jgi:hypothetical protein
MSFWAAGAKKLRKATPLHRVVFSHIDTGAQGCAAFAQVFLAIITPPTTIAISFCLAADSVRFSNVNETQVIRKLVFFKIYKLIIKFSFSKLCICRNKDNVDVITMYPDLDITDLDQPGYPHHTSYSGQPQVHCNKNPIYVFLFLELRGLSPNFHIQVFVSDLYFPQDRFTHFPAAE